MREAFCTVNSTVAQMRGKSVSCLSLDFRFRFDVRVYASAPGVGTSSSPERNFRST